MTTIEPQKFHPALSQTAEEQMKEFGITRVPIEYFLFGKYRYTNLNDAVAEARRDRDLR